ncbi:hypothetical protein [Streptomyces sp. MI02-7b]|uniref:hypothetical protein n=1 Tax=Streptomyces sp. MI02-7b TaxID=462941 RepID=UPI0029B8F971|nr:hypothetical protein [Streptomyces sp. MI02-7b]MDX3075871.1 hypothetical protein [Streptomyces sp. MI02-7b]
MSDVPMIEAWFWMIKIVATMLGESVSNFVSMAQLSLGCLTGARAGRFRPVIWSAILGYAGTRRR